MPAHTPLSHLPVRLLSQQLIELYECTIVFSVTSSAILIATVRAGRAREPRLDRLDAFLACVCHVLYLWPSVLRPLTAHLPVCMRLLSC